MDDGWRPSIDPSSFVVMFEEPEWLQEGGHSMILCVTGMLKWNMESRNSASAWGEKFSELSALHDQ